MEEGWELVGMAGWNNELTKKDGWSEEKDRK